MSPYRRASHHTRSDEGKGNTMSAQGGSLRSPIRVPIRPVLAATSAMVLVVAIGFGIAQLANEPAAGVGTGAQVTDIPMDGFGRIPEQRLHPVDVSGTADVPMDGFGRIPEQRLHPVDVSGTAGVPMDGFGRIPEQRLHPVDVSDATAGI